MAATVIYKYPLSLLEAVTHHLPAGYRLRHVGHQDGEPMLWVEGDPSTISKPVTFAVLGTGKLIPGNWEWVGTYQEGPYVWHVFKVNE